MVKKSISIVLVTEILILFTSFYSKIVFANIQVAFLSSLFVILGSSFAYKNMIQTNIESKNYEDKRDLLDEIDDPHGLYDDEEINEASVEELDLKKIVKEERAKIKTFSLSSIKHGARGGISLFRIIPYVFLILGFISLKNNEFLNLSFYLPSLLIGIIIGYVVSKKIIV